MRTRVWIGLFTLGAVIYAGSEHNLAAIYVALGTGAIVFLLHAIEAKLNRLLDHHGITVWDSEIARD